MQETLGPSNDAPEKLQDSFTWNIPRGMGDSCRFSCSGKGAQASTQTLHVGAAAEGCPGIVEYPNLEETHKDPSPAQGIPKIKEVRIPWGGCGNEGLGKDGCLQ